MKELFSVYIPILVYHEITPDSAMGEGPYSITVGHFERQMRYLFNHGYQSLSLMEYLRYTQHGTSNGQKAFVLTFDDGRDDFLTLAYPVLRRFGFSATMFLVTDYLEKREEKGEAPLLTWGQVVSLSREGISFGSHTCTHPRLVHLSNDQIRYELAASKELLEIRLGREISLLAYPFGESNSEVHKIAMEVGYKVACGVTRGENGLYNLWRCSCGRVDNALTFAFKLSCLFHYWLKFTNWIRDKTPFGNLGKKLKHVLSPEIIIRRVAKCCLRFKNLK